MKKLIVTTLLIINYVVTAQAASHVTTPKTFLVFGGKTGWIGQKMVKIIKDRGHIAVCAQSRLQNRESIIEEIERIKPDYIINAAGIIGKPNAQGITNIDWCEDHQQETIDTNVTGVLNLAFVAWTHGIHMTNVSTGCIYEYDEAHPMWSGKGFSEKDEPNFDGSFYSRTKIALEKCLLNFPNVLNLRVKMPVSTDMEHGFVAKIVKYKKLVNIPNSLTVLDDLLPIAVDMILRDITGNFNFVNPGAIAHHEVMALYKEIIDPTHTYESFTVEEHDKILKARRANAELSAEKLLALYPNIPPIKESLTTLFKQMKAMQHEEKVA